MEQLSNKANWLRLIPVSVEHFYIINPKSLIQNASVYSELLFVHIQ